MYSVFTQYAIVASERMSVKLCHAPTSRKAIAKPVSSERSQEQSKSPHLLNYSSTSGFHGFGDYNAELESMCYYH